MRLFRRGPLRTSAHKDHTAKLFLVENDMLHPCEGQVLARVLLEIGIKSQPHALDASLAESTEPTAKQIGNVKSASDRGVCSL